MKTCALPPRVPAQPTARRGMSEWRTQRLVLNAVSRRRSTAAQAGRAGEVGPACRWGGTVAEPGEGTTQGARKRARPVRGAHAERAGGVIASPGRRPDGTSEVASDLAVGSAPGRCGREWARHRTVGRSRVFESGARSAAGAKGAGMCRGRRRRVAARAKRGPAQPGAAPATAPRGRRTRCNRFAMLRAHFRSSGGFGRRARAGRRNPEGCPQKLWISGPAAGARRRRPPGARPAAGGGAGRSARRGAGSPGGRSRPGLPVGWHRRGARRRHGAGRAPAGPAGPRSAGAAGGRGYRRPAAPVG
jgi:hypothetical protein